MPRAPCLDFPARSDFLLGSSAMRLQGALPGPGTPRRFRKYSAHVSSGHQDMRRAIQLDRVGLDHRLPLPQPSASGVHGVAARRVRHQVVGGNVRRLRRKIRYAARRGA